jgi:hypothetical protein
MKRIIIHLIRYSNPEPTPSLIEDAVQSLYGQGCHLGSMELHISISDYTVSNVAACRALGVAVVVDRDSKGKWAVMSHNDEGRWITAGYGQS